MKKILQKLIAVFISLAIIIECFVLGASALLAAEEKLGDVNGDAIVNSEDALKIILHIVGSDKLDGTIISLADVDGDSKLTSTDTLYILEYSVGIIQAFPANKSDENSPSKSIEDSDMLRTKGTKIYNQKGHEVVLKGVNLGGWLVHENWMCPVTSEDTYTTYSVLTQRFGQETAYELIHEYEDNWITEYDIEQIKAFGFNCVRVPFWFRNFYYDDKGTKILDKNGNWDFSRLDWIVNQCQKNGLYVILDMHGAPGYQSNKDHSGKVNSSSLFDIGSENYRLLTIELWTAIAKRFSGNPAIAMYDLLNEPNCDSSSSIYKSVAAVNLYDRLYNAIRSVDPEHTITMEGIWRLFKLPSPALKGWTNVVYQMHLYQKTDLEFKTICNSAKLYPFNVPIYIGEFKSTGSATWDDFMPIFTSNNFSWTTWSYKGYGNEADKNDWFIYGSVDGSNDVDVENDSISMIRQKWGTVLRTQNNYKRTGLDKTLKPYI